MTPFMELNLRHFVEANSVVFNLSIDDIHPESSTYLTDCGGDREIGVFRHLLMLVKEFNNIKITLFVTANWIDKPDSYSLLKFIKRIFRMNYSNKWKNDPFRLDKHIEWCQWLNKLISSGNFEVGLHGLLHHHGNPYVGYHSMEFLNLSYEESLKRIIEAENIFNRAKLRFVKVFRPPGWAVSDGLFEALRELGYYLSCKSLNLTPEIVRGFLNIAPNWNIGEDSIEKGMLLAKKYGIVTAYGHITSRYGRETLKDGVDKNLDRIRTLLIKLMKNYNVKFLSMEEIAHMYMYIGK